MPNKHICKCCNYSTIKLNNYNKHLKTKKHIQQSKVATTGGLNNSGNSLKIQENPELISKKSIHNYNCQYCKKEVSNKYNLTMHHKTCNEKRIYELEQYNNSIIKELTIKNEKIAKEKEDILLTKNVIEEDYRKLIQSVGEHLKNNQSNNNVTIDNSVNIYQVINNYKDAHNYNDIMDKEVTKQEKKYILDNDPVMGCYKLIINRCITDMPKEKRPIHCTDISRNKYLVKVDDEWKTDINGSIILQPPSKIVNDVYEKNHQKKNICLIKVCETKRKMFDMEKNGHKLMNKYIGSITSLKETNNKTKIKEINDYDSEDSNVNSDNSYVCTENAPIHRPTKNVKPYGYLFESTDEESDSENSYIHTEDDLIDKSSKKVETTIVKIKKNNRVTKIKKTICNKNGPISKSSKKLSNKSNYMCVDDVTSSESNEECYLI
jgi:hypothetical protein